MDVFPRLADAPRQERLRPQPHQKLAVGVPGEISLGAGIFEHRLVHVQHLVSVAHVEHSLPTGPAQPLRQLDDSAIRAVQRGKILGHDNATQAAMRAAAYPRLRIRGGRVRHTAQCSDHANDLPPPDRTVNRTANPDARALLRFYAS
jgi:hypothetical protein